MELRVCARTGDRSVNDEIIARLLISLNYQPHIPVIRTAEGERLISLAVKFEHWLDFILGHENDSVIDGEEKITLMSKCGCGVRGASSYSRKNIGIQYASSSKSR
jgi:hypothetical protein